METNETIKQMQRQISCHMDIIERLKRENQELRKSNTNLKNTPMVFSEM